MTRNATGTTNCELCEQAAQLSGFSVAAIAPRDEQEVMLCDDCRMQVTGDRSLDPNHWFCLQASIWSERAPVQVLSWRLLRRLSPQESWAADLLDQAYLADDVLAWAQEGQKSEVEEDTERCRDSNGAELIDGDTVTLIKDLDVKGANFVAKRGTRVKGIRVSSEDTSHVEGKVSGVVIMLKTEFLKKA